MAHVRQLYIPGGVIGNILRRLPEESQFRFKVVCKEWKSIIMNDDPSFPKLDMLLFTSDHGELPCAMPLCSLNKTKMTCSSYIIHAKNINVDWNGRFLFQPSYCHSFFLLCNRTGVNWAVWNPFSGIRLEFTSRGVEYYGLGYDVKTNDHKLVRLLEHGHNGRHVILKTLIYSFKSQAWHWIQDFPEVEPWTIHHAVFANGRLYWHAHCYEGDQQKVLISLDLSTETYNTLQLPCCSIKSGIALWGYTHRLYALEGCLFLNCIESCGAYGPRAWPVGRDLWILQDCEKGSGKKHWKKLIALPNTSISCSDPYPVIPIAYVKSKEQLLIRYDEELFMWFNLKSNKCLKTVTIKGIESTTCQVLPATHGWLSGNHKNASLKLDIET